jgi:hypothetical protein
MLNLPDSGGVFTPSVSNPSNLTAFQADLDAIESELVCRRQADEAAHAAEMQRLQREDDGHCTGCGMATEGVTVAGQQLRVCPDCLAGFIAEYQRPRRPLEVPKPITARCRIPVVAIP